VDGAVGPPIVVDTFVGKLTEVSFDVFEGVTGTAVLVGTE